MYKDMKIKQPYRRVGLPRQDICIISEKRNALRITLRDNMFSTLTNKYKLNAMRTKYKEQKIQQSIQIK